MRSDITVQLTSARPASLFDSINNGSEGARLPLLNNVAPNRWCDHTRMDHMLDRSAHANYWAGEVGHWIELMSNQISGRHHYLDIIVQ